MDRREAKSQAYLRACSSKRSAADGILEAVAKGGAIQFDTIKELCVLLTEKTDFPFHIAVEIKTGAILKVIDNEDDAVETIRRLRGMTSAWSVPIEKYGRTKHE